MFRKPYNFGVAKVILLPVEKWISHDEATISYLCLEVTWLQCSIYYAAAVLGKPYQCYVNCIPSMMWQKCCSDVKVISYGNLIAVVLHTPRSSHVQKPYYISHMGVTETTSSSCQRFSIIFMLQKLHHQIHMVATSRSHCCSHVSGMPFLYDYVVV